MLNKVRVRVNGKLNLSLNILGKRGNLHTLDSVLSSVSLYDTVTVRDRLDDKINLIFNAGYAVKDNTAIKAVNALRESFGNFGADIVVDKRIPLAGGMGGSSADGAGVIAALSALFDFDKRGLDFPSVCNKVGADVIYMLSGGFARMGGVGDEITPISCKTTYGVVFSYCGALETREVYGAFDTVGGEGKADNDALIASLIKGEFPQLGNMLYRSACSLLPRIAEVMAVYELIGLHPNMTGSGSVVYALCDDPKIEAERLKERGVSAEAAFTRLNGIEIE